MCKLFNQWENEIKDYCNKNNLDFEKVKTSPKCWGKNDIWIQHTTGEKGQKGLLDETPAPIILMISEKNGHLEFEQTEYTQHYLAV